MSAAPRTVAAAFAIVAALAAAVPAGAATERTLHLRAVFTQATIVDVPPAGPSLGDEQVASGLLRRAGATVGRFGFTCTWVAIFPDHVLEQCAGWGRIGGDQLEVAGMSRSDDAVHHWAIVGGTGRFTGASGQARIEDVNDHVSLVRLRFALP